MAIKYTFLVILYLILISSSIICPNDELSSCSGATCGPDSTSRQVISDSDRSEMDPSPLPVNPAPRGPPANLIVREILEIQRDISANNQNSLSIIQRLLRSFTCSRNRSKNNNEPSAARRLFNILILCHPVRRDVDPVIGEEEFEPIRGPIEKRIVNIVSRLRRVPISESRFPNIEFPEVYEMADNPYEFHHGQFSKNYPSVEPNLDQNIAPEVLNECFEMMIKRAKYLDASEPPSRRSSTQSPALSFASIRNNGIRNYAIVGSILIFAVLAFIVKRNSKVELKSFPCSHIDESKNQFFAI
jgi:hypothetical protein